MKKFSILFWVECHARRISSLILLLFAIFIVQFGQNYHPFEFENGENPELDGYVHFIDQLRQGHIPRDTFRPIFYEIASWPFAALFGDSFIGGRIVSNLAAVLFLASSYYLAAALIGECAALLSLLLLILNPYLWIFGQTVATDMLASALVCSALALLVSSFKKPGPLKFLSLGILSSLAFFTRYTALSLIAVECLGLTLFFWRQKPRLVLGFYAGLILASLPFLAMNYLVFGKIFYTENWLNLAWKLWPGLDVFTLYEEGRLGVQGMADLLRLHGTELLGLFANTLLQFVRRDWSHALGHVDIGKLFIVFALGTGLRIVWSGSLMQRLLLIFFILYLGLISFTFVITPRFILVLIPLTLIAGLAGLQHVLARSSGWRFQRVGVFAAWALILFLSLGQWQKVLLDFKNSHPRDEHRALKFLADNFNQETRVLGCSLLLRRTSPVAYTPMPVQFGEKLSIPAFYEQIKKQARETGAQYFMVSPVNNCGYPILVEGGASLPDFLSPIALPEIRNVRVFKLKI